MKNLIILKITLILLSCNKINFNQNEDFKNLPKINIEKKKIINLEEFIKDFYMKYLSLWDDTKEFDKYLNSKNNLIKKSCTDKLFNEFNIAGEDNDPFYIGSNHPDGKISILKISRKNVNTVEIIFTDTHFPNRKISAKLKVIEIENNFKIDSIEFIEF